MAMSSITQRLFLPNDERSPLEQCTLPRTVHCSWQRCNHSMVLVHVKRDLVHVKRDLVHVKRDLVHVKRDLVHVKRDLAIPSCHSISHLKPSSSPPCHLLSPRPEEALNVPTFSHLLIFNERLSLSLSLSLSHTHTHSCDGIYHLMPFFCPMNNMKKTLPTTH